MLDPPTVDDIGIISPLHSNTRFTVAKYDLTISVLMLSKGALKLAPNVPTSPLILPVIFTDPMSDV